MKRITLQHALVSLAWVACTLATAQTAAQTTAQTAPPAEEPEYQWNAMQGEKLQVLRAKGDPLRGEISFEVCQGCHRAKALGRPDGSYPRLAGQHDTVLIKQMTDVRAGRRRNDKMLPFADRHVIGPQDIADIATFLAALPVPPDNGKGPGDRLAAAEKAYQADCAECHGKVGEGDGARFYPRVSGQHYKYLLRELIDIRDGARTNAYPRMRSVVRPLSNEQLSDLADLMSRLPVAASR